MDKIKGFAIELDLDHLSVDRGLRGLKDNLRTVNSEMKRNMSAFDRSDRSAEKYETRLSGLNKKLEVQKVAVSEAKKEYEKMVEQHGHGSKEAEKAAREYNNQSASLNNLERYIGRTKDELVKFEREQRIASDGFTKLGDKLDGASKKLRTASERMGAVGSTLTRKITKPALGAATALATLAVYKGFQRLVGIDTARAQLKALGHDAEGVEQIMDAALNSARGTSFGLDEAATTAATAVAAGVDPVKDLEKYLALAADTASVANIPFNEMGDIFNKVQTSGKAQNDVLKQLSQRGIPIYQYLGTTIGKSTDEVVKMARDGKISTKDFLKAVEDNIGGASKIIGEESFVASVKNIGSDIGRIGANFLDAGGKGGGFFSKLKPLLVDFRGWLEKAEDASADLGIKFGEAFENMVEKAKALKKRYDDLSPAQQEFVNKVLLIAPAVAIGIGPAITLFSKLTAGISFVVGAAGKLSTAIGVARGAGLVAGLASLGPLAVGGIAVAGLAAISVGIYTLYKRSQKAKEVNIDLAQSLSDEATELENTAEAFDKLSSKAKISNEQLAILNDLNKRISESSNPGEIKELQEQYDELAKKSGLSKDELKKLFTANDEIIKQSPEVEKSVSRQGNAFIENTDAVAAQVAALRDLSETQLKAEHAKLVEQEAEARKKVTAELEKQEELNKRLDFLVEMQGTSQKDLNDLIYETAIAIADAEPGSKKQIELSNEWNDLVAIRNGDLVDQIDLHLETIDASKESIVLEQEKLDKLDATEQQMMNIKLANVGINEEGEKGLAQLDKSIAKNEEELQKLDEKLKINGELTDEELARHNELSTSIEKQREARDVIFEELDMYKDLNSLVQAKLDMSDEQTKKNVEIYADTLGIKVEEGNIVDQVKKKNEEYDKSISKLEKQKKEEGANKEKIDEQIQALKDKKDLNGKNIEFILRELNIWEDVKDTIDLGTDKEKQKGEAVASTMGVLAKQGDEIGNNNKLTDTGIQKEKERSNEAGRHVTKKVTAKDYGTVAKIDKDATEEVSKRIKLKSVGLGALNKQASSPVTKTINFIGKGLSALKFWEKGTPPSGHPGGPAVIGEKGSELVKLPSGRSFVSPNSHTLLDLPKGSHVIPHNETKRIIKNAPRYAAGTDGWVSALDNSEFARLLMMNDRSESEVVFAGSGQSNNSNDSYSKKLLEATLQQNQLLMQLLQKDNRPVIDRRSLARGLEPEISKLQGGRVSDSEVYG